MAYAALVSLSQILEQILPNHQDYTCLCEKEDLESLHSNVTFLQKLLADFTGNQSSEISQLESRITNAAYHANDIIACEVSDRTTCSPIFGGNDARIFSLQNMYSTFGSCIGELNSIVKEALQIKKSSETMDRGDLVCHFRTPSASAFSVVGLEDDLIQIKERVAVRNSALRIIPIVGMGGIGKTTLARMVYGDRLILDEFYIRTWVTVSQDYDAKKILWQICDEQRVQSDEDVENLVVRVYQRLKGRKFIVVLDDMWHTEVWDKLRRAFPDDNNGSRVILTTRLLNVAKYVDSSNLPHQMHLLNEVHSWVLFQEEVYGQQRCPPELENIGKVISGNCKGLPLAIAVTSRLLKVNATQDYWEKFAKKITGATASTSDIQLFEILSLSYDNLPAYLKACFLYMSLFPEDHKIPIKKLIRLWVAEGFVEPRRDESLEEVAEHYLVDLIERNLLMVAEKGSSGRIRSCSIHDVLRELSIRKAQEEKFLHHIMHRYTDKKTEKNTMSATVYQRRIHVTGYDVIHSLRNDTNYKTIHSLLIFFHPENQELPFFGVFRLLRVLDVLHIIFDKDMVLEVFSLVNLRYLAYTIDGPLLYPKFHENLETLIVNQLVKRGYLFHALEIKAQELPKLRNFVYIGRNMVLPKYYPRLVSVISNSLRTLSGAVNMDFTAAAVESLQNLVELKAEYRDAYLGGRQKYGLHNLANLHRLEELALCFSCEGGDNYVSPIPVDIAFPDTLRKLTLNHFIILTEQMSVINLLPNLELLKLIKCSFESNEWDLVEGGFPRLKYLKLKQIQNLEIWNVESMHFPCLKQLTVTRCDDLKEVPAEVGHINTLKKLVLENCPERLRESVRIIQEEQECYGNAQLEIFVSEEKWRAFSYFI